MTTVGGRPRARRTVLAIDAGNTRIKWGAHNGVRWLAQGWVETARATELKAAFAGLDALQSIVISNVAGVALRKAITRALPPRPICSAATGSSRVSKS